MCVSINPAATGVAIITGTALHPLQHHQVACTVYMCYDIQCFSHIHVVYSTMLYGTTVYSTTIYSNVLL